MHLPATFIQLNKLVFIDLELPSLGKAFLAIGSTTEVTVAALKV